jgi:alkaline phosphatase
MRADAKKIKPLIIYAVLFLILLNFGNCSRNDTYPKNIIIYIGDGMGVAHITAGKIALGTLNLERFAVAGLVTTHAENTLIADSASAATALATGHKTNNRTISVSADKKPLKTIFEFAEERGKSTGVVVTAAFFAHIEDRRQHAEIAEQILNSDLDVLIGGGWMYFIPQSNAGSRRPDNKNLLELLETKMPVVLSYDKLSGQAKKLAALLAPDGLPKSTDRDYSLAELTEVAIRILSKNRKGFILLVEGSQIDWAAHDQNHVDFDGAVGTGLDFAQKHGNTLILVTADHETGGFAVHEGSMKAKQVTSSGFTTSGHTASMVPIFAYGPESRNFSGIQDNTRVGQTLIDLLLKREIDN